MTVQELKKILETLDQTEEIFVSIDEEGNDFKRIHEISIEDYDDEGSHWNAFDIKKGYIIWPIG